MLSSVVREEVRGAAIGDWETVEMWVPVKEVTPVYWWVGNFLM